ncbi:MAG: sugar nucleotide-binding protein [Microgenomates group bacterium]
MKRLAFTGGSGLLGKELQKYFPDALFPTHHELDITDTASITAYFQQNVFDDMVHLAAFTSPPRIDKDPSRALMVNIMGTANIVSACITHAKKIIYISTDYVFKGDKQKYSEEDAVYPVNKYAWSKLGGECAVRLYDNHLIIRTSFGATPFPYKQAFTDQWTSRESVHEIAKKIKRIILSQAVGTYHVGGIRRTVFDYAISLESKNDISPISRSKVGFEVPKDTSLNTDKYEKLIEKR